MISEAIYALLLDNGRLVPLCYARERDLALTRLANWKANVAEANAREPDVGVVAPSRPAVAMVKIWPKK